MEDVYFNHRHSTNGNLLQPGAGHDIPGREQENIVAVLFDLDNTLIATRKADKLACNKLAQILWEKYAVPVDLAAACCKSYLRTFRKCPENPQMDLDSWRHLLWRQALGDQYNKLAGEIYQTWLKLRYDYLALTPEIRSLLVGLRQNYFVGLITNGTSCAQWEKIDRLNLHSFFDVILVSGDHPWEKPHHKIFHEACQYLGVEPAQCIMVGDKLETDILGGIRAELGGTVWIPLESAEVEEESAFNPDFVLENVTQLPTLLPKRKRAASFRSCGKQKLFQIALSDLDDGNSNSSDGS